MSLKPRNLVYLAIVLALLIHGALLPFTYGQTYDAYIHMFFGDHYNRQWFDPWETRWYTGFTVTAYPPGSHQTLALLMKFMDMRAAFVVIMTGAVATLVIGIYRFAQIWVSQKAAAMAALLTVFSSAIAETVHIFGQLPTIFSIALFLNALPHMSRWIEKGNLKDLFFALCFAAGATAAHHVTPLFGTIFFVAPIGLAAWIAHLKTTAPPQGIHISIGEIWRWVVAPCRGIILGICMIILIVGIVFPYWHWSITDPITQVSIPHGSRESFIEKPNLGLMFFVIPWGLLFFVLPYVVLKLKSSLWPLGITILFALLLGTGGTTPLPKMILHGAFDILTLDRFTFWASLLILPIAGMLAVSLMEGRARVLLKRAFGELGSRLLLVALFALYALGPIAIALLPQIRPTQPDFVDPAPIVKFMDEDGHNQWRYLTLGLGDQFAYHSALINAESVDGNYNSARRLPALTNYAVERLENSKFAGVPGLASLNQFLTNADRFHLKYVFSNDEYYDPLLHYTGWNPVVRLGNGMMVWEKANIPPLPVIRAKRQLPRYQVYWWGVIPIFGVGLSVFALFYLAVRGRLISRTHIGYQPDNVPTTNSPSKFLLWSVRVVPMAGLIIALVFTNARLKTSNEPLAAQDLILQYYGHLDFREYDKAYGLLETDISYSDFLRDQRLRGGLLPSYGKLIDTNITSDADNKIAAQLTYLTAIGYKSVQVSHEIYAGRLRYQSPVPQFSNDMVTFETSQKFLDQTSRNIIRPTREKTAKLQRPRIEASQARLYEEEGRFYVMGQLRNTSPFTACIQLIAKARDAEGKILATQNMGRLGAHRLLPGETSPYLVAFEGFLKIPDASFNSPYDPDQFSVPEFLENPQSLSVDIQSTVCSPDIYKSLNIEALSINDNDITFALSNRGTASINTLQLKLTLSDSDQFRVVPFYIQESLKPGERRLIRIARPALIPTITSTDQVRVNGIEKTSFPLSEGQFVQNGVSVDITYDGMTYDILR